MKLHNFGRVVKSIKNISEILLPSRVQDFLTRALGAETFLSQVEFHLVDHCNLNCAHCDHFTPLSKPCFIPVEDILSDFKKLKRIFDNVGKIYILGGEPLLHPQLLELFSPLREIYPKSELIIITNGILLEKMGKDFWNALKEYKISLGNLQKRKNFADRQVLPLMFAISIKGFWGLFTVETLLEKGGKVTIDDFLGENASSLLDNRLATCSYLFKKPVKIRSVYSTNHAKGMGIEFEPYGELISYELYYDDKRIFKAKGKESRYILHTIYLEALHDRVANGVPSMR